MSTYLELCQATRLECRLSGTGPTTVTGQAGELARVCHWVSRAYVEIQSRHAYWRWLRSSWSTSTVSGTPYIVAGAAVTDTVQGGTLATRFGRWWALQSGRPCTRIYLTSAGVGTEGWVTYLPWDDFVRTHVFGRDILVAAGMPSVMSIDPTNRIVLAQTPNDVYTVKGDYQRSPQILSVDADEPEMPEQFHYLIVYEAIRKYAAETGSPSLWAAAKDEASRLWGDLRVDQLPAGRFAGPIA